MKKLLVILFGIISFTHIIKDPSLLYQYHIGDSVYISCNFTLEVVDPDT